MFIDTLKEGDLGYFLAKEEGVMNKDTGVLEHKIHEETEKQMLYMVTSTSLTPAQNKKVSAKENLRLAYRHIKWLLI